MKHFFMTWPLVLSCIAAVLLFVDSLYSRRDDLSNVTLWLSREIFGMGPRLMLESFRLAKRAVQFASLDANTCAAVLAYLANKKQSVAKDELLKMFPDVAWPELRSQLRLVQGVLFLRADFSRATLSQPLRLRLRKLLNPEGRATRGTQESKEPAPVTEPEKLSSYEILGVTPSASLAEIKLAYRTRIKECHPDRFGELDETSRNLAEEWTKALNAAYDALMAEHARTK